MMKQELEKVNSPMRQQLVALLSLEDRHLPVTKVFQEDDTAKHVKNLLDNIAKDRGFGSYATVTAMCDRATQDDFFRDAIAVYDEIDILVDPALNK